MTFAINVASILAIDEPNQVLSLESTLRIEWIDSRINVTVPEEDADKGYITFNRDPTGHIWFPDVFVDKAKELRVPIYKIPPVYLRMFPG